MLEVVIATILGVNVGFYIGFVCGKERTYKEAKPNVEDTIKQLERFRVIDECIVKEDKPFIIEDDDDIFLKINNDKEEIV